VKVRPDNSVSKKYLWNTEARKWEQTKQANSKTNQTTSCDEWQLE